MTSRTTTQSTWQLQEAKNKFSQVVGQSAKKPQIITRHGDKTAVVMSYKDYEELVGHKPGIKEALLSYPGVDMPDFSADRKDIPERGTPFSLEEYIYQ